MLFSLFLFGGNAEVTIRKAQQFDSMCIACFLPAYFWKGMEKRHLLFPAQCLARGRRRDAAPSLRGRFRRGRYPRPGSVRPARSSNMLFWKRFARFDFLRKNVHACSCHSHPLLKCMCTASIPPSCNPTALRSCIPRPAPPRQVLPGRPAGGPGPPGLEQLPQRAEHPSRWRGPRQVGEGLHLQVRGAREPLSSFVKRLLDYSNGRLELHYFVHGRNRGWEQRRSAENERCVRGVHARRQMGG